MSETIVAGRRLTRADYRALPEGPPYYELIDGELIEMTRARRSRYRLNAIVVAPAEFAPAAFPGWKLPLAELDAALAPAAGPDPGAARADHRPE